MNLELTFFATGFTISTTLLFLIVAKFPFVITNLNTKNAVLEINDAGIGKLTKSRTTAGGMVTKMGTYLYRKVDVVRFYGINVILANKDSDARGLNPDIMPVISFFRQHGVDSLEDVESILKAELITEDEYKARYLTPTKEGTQ